MLETIGLIRRDNKMLGIVSECRSIDHGRVSFQANTLLGLQRRAQFKRLDRIIDEDFSGHSRLAIWIASL